MKHPKHSLALIYYISLLVVILFTMMCYRLVYARHIFLAPNDPLVVQLSSIIIMYVIASLPVALMGFSMLLKRIARYPDDGSRERYYKIYAVARIVLITLGLLAAIAGLYLLQQRSMMWLAGIAAIGLIFCKPTEKKIDADFEKIKSFDNPNEETIC